MELPLRLIKWTRSKLDGLIDPIIKQASKMKLFKDMDDNQYFLTVWTFAITAATTIAAVIVYYLVTENIIISNLVKAGHDPIELTCLFNPSRESVEGPCILIANAKAKAMTDAIK